MLRDAGWVVNIKRQQFAGSPSPAEGRPPTHLGGAFC